MQKTTTARKHRFRFRLAAIVMLVGGGLVLTLWQPAFFPELLAGGRELAERPWAAVALVVLLAVLLALAMPGSLMVLVFAPLYPPAMATALLTVGGVIGSWGAYVIARWAGATGPTADSRPVMQLLARRGDFLTQLILRVMPAFPHSVVNYGAGLLGLPLPTFLAAAALGLAVKWYIYSTAIHTLLAAGSEGEPLGPRTAAPLFLLAGLLIAGAFVRHLLLHRRQKEVHGSRSTVQEKPDKGKRPEDP
jgi:uncharacterized membrane protein YdjX (TVP38/TMEM64 family)